jgi:UDP-glucose 4-epimerase
MGSRGEFLNILVTGVGGFIGAAVAKRFLIEGHTVFGVDDFSVGKREKIPTDVELIEINLSSKESIRKLPNHLDAILHLAGQSSGEISFDDPVDDLEKNTISTLNLVRYGLNNKLKRFVYASSMSVYGDVEPIPIAETSSCSPVSCYGVGKYASEQYLNIYKKQIPSVILRMFNVYGPGQDLTNLRQGMVSIYLAQAIDRGVIEVKGNVSRFRDLVYIDDMVEAWYRSTVNNEVVGQTINVGTGVKTTVKQLLMKINELIPNSTFTIQEGTPGDQSGIYSDTSKMSRLLLPASTMTSLDKGLLNFYNWAINDKN